MPKLKHMVSPENKAEYQTLCGISNYFRLLLNNINGRCNSKTRYSKGTRKNYLTKDDLLYLWKRDNAINLEHPSIDRIDQAGDYSLDNCRFIEMAENRRLWMAGQGKKRGSYITSDMRRRANAQQKGR